MRTPLAFRISTVLAVSLALGFTTGCHRDPNKQKQKYLESGKRYAAEGKLKEASIQFSNALKVDHNFADAHYELSKVYLKQGSMLPGYAELMRTVDLQPSNLQARIDLGSLLVAANEPGRAEEQAKAVLAAQPNNADAFSLLANIAALKGDRAGAISQIQHAISLDPNKANFHAMLGYLQTGDPATAAAGEDELRKAVALDGKSISSRLVLASLLERKGDLAGAEENLKAAIVADPKNEIARATLADLYQRQGNTAKAEETLRQASDDINDTTAGADMLANYLIRAKQLDQAESAYTDLIAKHPKSTPLKVAYARILILKKDLPKARTVIAELEKADSSAPNVALLNSLILLNDGKTQEAFDDLQKAAKANPDNLQLKIWLGRAARAKGDLPAAQLAFRDATRLNPKSMEAQEGLAQTAVDLRDFTGLAQTAEAAMAIAPQSPLPYLWRGMAEGSQKDYARADADFSTAIKYDPKNSASYLELAQLRLLQQHIPEGQGLLEQSLALNPNSSRALRILASTYLFQKQPAKAISRVQEQLAKAPQNSDMYALLADLQLQTGDAKASLASAQKAMQLNPADPNATMTYTRAQISLGDTGKAIDTWQQWLKTHPNDAQAYTLLGSLQEAHGDRDQAMDSYKKALQIQPEQPIAANNLAYLMVETGQNSDVALSLAQIARRALPDSSSTADTLAWVYYQKGNFTSARSLLEDALKTAPNNASMHYHLGMTYSKLANNADATLHLKKAAALAPNTQTAKDAEKALSSLT
jgi:tetratricopeptide (TPR) repeat protein